MSTSRRLASDELPARSFAKTKSSTVGRAGSPPYKILIARSFAKVNLGLTLIGRRADGFHELRTVFQSIDLCDELTFEARRDGRIVLECDDSRVPVDSKNLVVRAAKELSASASLPRGVNIHLKKRIPMGAGLGGGSSNAGTTLLALRRLFGLKLRSLQLQKIASSLGSDVPFFLLGGRILGIGRGNELFPVPDMKTTAFLLACPERLSISTEAAYREGSLWLTNNRQVNNMARFGLEVFEKENALGLFENDFERVLFPKYPPLRRLKSALLAVGAQGAQMTGSGSALFGIFPSIADARRAEEALRSRHSASSLLTFVVRSIPRSQYLKRIFAASG